MVSQGSIFGKFCNYCYFWVEGKDVNGKRKLKKLCAISEAEAIRRAQAAGVSGPFKVRSEALEPPTERQLSLAEKINLFVPEGCTKDDLSAMLSRRLDFDEDMEPDPGLLEYAKDCGVCFSVFSGELGLLQNMIAQLFPRDRAVLFAYAVYLACSKEKQFKDPRKTPKAQAFERFADMVEADPELWKSLEGRDLRDYRSPNTRTKVYKAVINCL